MIDRAALKTELLTDPAGVGYATFIRPEGNSSIHLANLGNAPQVAIRINKGPVVSSELVLAIDQSEYDALSDRKALQWQTLTASPEVDLSDARVMAQITAIFGGASATLSTINTLSQRNGSRFEALFGQNATRIDISEALLS